MSAGDLGGTGLKRLSLKAMSLSVGLSSFRDCAIENGTTLGFSRTGGGIFLLCFGDFGATAASEDFKAGWLPPTAENDLETLIPIRAAWPVGVSLLSLPLPPLELNLTLDLFCLSLTLRALCRGGRLLTMFVAELIEVWDEGEGDTPGQGCCCCWDTCLPTFQFA